jgi:hypothetical protein
VPAGGVEAAEKERRHSRGHRHGRAPSPRQQLIRERTVCNKLALASLQVKHRLSQEEEVNQGGRTPEIFRPRRARVCLSYAAAARKKNAWRACSLRLDPRVSLLLLLFSRCHSRSRLPTGCWGMAFWEGNGILVLMPLPLVSMLELWETGRKEGPVLP